MSAVAAVHGGHWSIKECTPRIGEVLGRLNALEDELCHMLELLEKGEDTFEVSMLNHGRGPTLVRFGIRELISAKRREISEMRSLFVSVQQQVLASTDRLLSHRLTSEAPRIARAEASTAA
jgi:hypothetical protein